MDVIKLFLVDDHTMVREGLKLALGSHDNLEVIGEASNGIEAIEKILASKPDIVLMDISMPGKDGLSAAKEIKNSEKSIKIIILTMLENELYVLDTLRNNIEGFIYKDSSINELLTAISEVYKGNKYFNKEISDKILDYIANRNDKEASQSEHKPLLTSRQIEIIRHVAKGLTSKEVAEKLFLSELTVIKHRKNIIKKLDLKNFTEVVSYAYQQGII